MKVMHFHFGKDGGAERFFVHLLNGLAERGVEQRIVIRPGRAWKSKIDPSVRIIESHFRTASPDRLLLPLRMSAMARSWKPDAILGWMPKGAKLVPNVEGPLKLTRLGDYPTTLKKFRTIDTVVCNTPGIAKHVRDMGWQQDVCVISNFTDPTRAQPVSRAELDTPEDAFVISASGRFVPRKGFDVVLRAAARLPDAYLWIIGNGEEEENLRRLADELGVAQRVRFAGWQSNPGAFVAASNCYAVASRHEPLGNVVLEAWAQDVPVVSTRSEGPTWFMRDGANGLLVDLDDHEAMADRIARIRNDATLAEMLVEGGRQTLRDRFSKEAITQRYMDLFARRDLAPLDPAPATRA